MLARLANEIEQHGWISFARYLQLVLHEPGLGYYAGSAQKFGRAGDFVTAPELGKLFGRTLARQLGQIGGSVLEIGAGSGALAETLLDELSCEYVILETSAELRERQRARLGNRVQFIDRLPQRWAGTVIANEVVDAMPVHAVAWTERGQSRCLPPIRARSDSRRAPGCVRLASSWPKALSSSSTTAFRGMSITTRNAR